MDDAQINNIRIDGSIFYFYSSDFEMPFFLNMMIINNNNPIIKLDQLASPFGLLMFTLVNMRARNILPLFQKTESCVTFLKSIYGIF